MAAKLFKSEINPLNSNQTIIYEIGPGISQLHRFAVDKANFETDIEYDNFIKYLTEALNFDYFGS